MGIDKESVAQRLVKEKYTKVQLQEIYKKGELATEWRQHPYTQLLFEKMNKFIDDVKKRKDAVPFKMYLLEKDGQKMLETAAMDEERAETYSELIKGSLTDERFGIHAEEAIRILDSKTSVENKK